MLDKNVKNKLIEISKKYKLDFLILFGSRAKGNNREDSDWDFAYYKLNNNVNYEKLYKDILKVINYSDLNLINLSLENSYILEEEIFRNGIIIYNKKEEIYFERRSQTFINYVDYKNYDYILENSLNSNLELSKKYSKSKKIKWNS